MASKEKVFKYQIRQGLSSKYLVLFNGHEKLKSNISLQEHYGHVDVQPDIQQAKSIYLTLDISLGEIVMFSRILEKLC